MYYQISSHCWSLLTVLQIFSTVFGSTNPYVVICCVSLSVSFNLEIPFLFFFFLVTLLKTLSHLSEFSTLRFAGAPGCHLMLFLSDPH